MKLFGRTGGYYLFWTGFVYFWTGVYLAFTHAARPEIATAIWVCVLALPFVIPPLGRYFNLDVEWDRKMFDWMKKNKMPKNVVPFPAPQAVPKIEPPKEPEKPVTTFYRLGITNNSRVSLQMGYSEITMNADGIDNMIRQLQVFRDQIRDYEEQE
jgi:hypothetical protein